MANKTVRQVAEEHWEWIEGILAKRQDETKHLFVDGFIHGYKHGKADKADRRIVRRLK